MKNRTSCHRASLLAARVSVVTALVCRTALPVHGAKFVHLCLAEPAEGEGLVETEDLAINDDRLVEVKPVPSDGRLHLIYRRMRGQMSGHRVQRESLHHDLLRHAHLLVTPRKFHGNAPFHP